MIVLLVYDSTLLYRMMYVLSALAASEYTTLYSSSSTSGIRRLLVLMVTYIITSRSIVHLSRV